MRQRHDIPPLKFGLDDKGADADPHADGLAPDAGDGLDARNRRRLDLIDKRYLEGGLSAAEEEELSALQAEFEALMDERLPPPFEALDALERLVERLESEGSPR